MHCDKSLGTDIQVLLILVIDLLLGSSDQHVFLAHICRAGNLRVYPVLSVFGLLFIFSLFLPTTKNTSIGAVFFNALMLFCLGLLCALGPFTPVWCLCPKTQCSAAGSQLLQLGLLSSIL